MLEKILENPLDSKEIKPLNPIGNQSWIFIGRTGTKAEGPTLWPPDSENQLFGKEPEAEKDWRQEEKGTTEDEILRWHHQLNGRESESEQAPGVGDGQWGLACCSPCCHKESDMTEPLNWTELNSLLSMYGTRKQVNGGTNVTFFFFPPLNNDKTLQRQQSPEWNNLYVIQNVSWSM